MSITQKAMVDSVKKWLGPGSINFFGMQLSGKDTQAMLFAELLGGHMIGGGDILRNSKVPKTVQDALAKGNLVPQKEYVNIVVPYLARAEFKDHPLMLSAVGRWLGEEQNVLAATKAANHPMRAAVHLLISEETAFARLVLADRGRDDDHHENLVNRITEFRSKTLPVLEVYRHLGLLVEVDGENTPEKVTEDILAALYQRAIG